MGFRKIMPRGKKESELKRARDLLARYFDEIGRNTVLPKETLKMVRYAFIFGQLCKEVDIIEGKKLFDGLDNDEK